MNEAVRAYIEDPVLAGELGEIAHRLIVDVDGGQHLVLPRAGLLEKRVHLAVRPLEVHAVGLRIDDDVAGAARGQKQLVIPQPATVLEESVHLAVRPPVEQLVACLRHVHRASHQLVRPSAQRVDGVVHPHAAVPVEIVDAAVRPDVVDPAAFEPDKTLHVVNRVRQRVHEPRVALPVDVVEHPVGRFEEDVTRVRRGHHPTLGGDRAPAAVGGRDGRVRPARVPLLRVEVLVAADVEDLAVFQVHAVGGVVF